MSTLFAVVVCSIAAYFIGYDEGKRNVKREIRKELDKRDVTDLATRVDSENDSLLQ